MLPLLIIVGLWLILHGRIGKYAALAGPTTARTPTASGGPSLVPHTPDPYGAPGTNQGPGTTFNAPLPGDSFFNSIYPYFGLPPIQYRTAP